MVPQSRTQGLNVLKCKVFDKMKLVFDFQKVSQDLILHENPMVANMSSDLDA